MTCLGRRLPGVHLATLVDDELCLVNLEVETQGRRALVVGLPGAFSPVCTRLHLPALVRSAARLKASGYEQIYCVAPDNPWVMREWAQRLDPEGRLLFLSDGNMEFVRAAGLATREKDLFLGDCSKRYSLDVRNAVVERAAVEDRAATFNCTRPSQLIV